MQALDSSHQLLLDSIDEHEYISQNDDGINYKKSEDILKYLFDNVEESNEVSNFDLSIGPSFEDYMNITRLLEQRSIKMTNIHKENDSGLVVDEYISQIFDEILIFFSGPKSLDYEIRENQITLSEIYLPTYYTVCTDPDF